jgi:hypothetical protein
MLISMIMYSGSYFKIIVPFFLLIPFFGCSTVSSGMQDFTVSTTPDTADIYINGDLAGKGYAVKNVKAMEGVDIKVMAPGYEPYEKHVPATLSSTGMADLFCGYLCLFPGVGLLTPGAHQLTEEHLKVIMDPIQNPASAIPSTQEGNLDSQSNVE